MILTGVSAHGVELAQMLATLLQRHGHIDNPPESLDALLAMGRNALVDPSPAYCVVQEGGSSTELYLHVWDRKEQAEQDRIDCSKDGAYRTSDVFEVPGMVAIQPGFFDAMEAAVQSVLTLDCVEVPEWNEDAPESDDADPMFVRSEAIKAEYLASGCQASDVDEAVEKLMAECGELFEDDRAAWEFIMEETHEDNEPDDAPRYLIAEAWDHIFAGVGKRPARFVYDRRSEKIVCMHVQVGFDGWKVPMVGQMADVEDSLNTANADALTNPGYYGLIEADELPAWATATAKAMANADFPADYTVAVEVQVTADSHEDAARFALADLRDKGVQAWVMTVTNSQGSKDVTVPGDLEESA
jgi:hypothetical protein